MNFRTAAAGMILASTGAQADTEAPSLPRVEVVGSRLPRVDAETALPVQIIRREEIERSGVTTVEELLGLVSANFGGTLEATTTANSLISGRSSASLRGLGATRTLVLLNGRRIANYAFSGNFGGGVDLHAIPLAAIERVEVLKDGASALYGSDAIGGVINFVTRRDFAGAEVFGSYTKTEAGGADSGRATLAAGTGRVESDGFNVFGVLDLRNAERLKGSERSFSSMRPYQPELGAVSNDPRTWPGNIRSPRPTGGFDIRSLNFPACTSDSSPVLGACRFNTSAASDLLPSSRQVGFFGMGTLRLSAQTDVYAEVLASTSRIRHEDPPTPVSTTESQRGTPFVLPASSPYYPTGVTLPSNWALAYRTVPLGPSTTEVESNNVRVLVGLRSRQWDWDLDGAIATNRTWSRERYVSGMVDAGRLSSAFATGLLNPFGPSGPEGDALLAASEVRGISREATGTTQSADLRAIRELTVLPGGPLGIALGLEARRESLEDVKMPIAADVLYDFPASPKQGSRRVQAAYVEIVAPVVKGFEIQAAARVDHYSDFGTAFSPKLAMRFEATPGVLLRASAGRGFRAPSLPELYTQQRHSFFELAILGLTDPVRCPVTHLASDCQPGVDVVTGGNPALQPQRSTQSSLGIVVAPAPGWLASLDVWRIHIDSNITNLTLQRDHQPFRSLRRSQREARPGRSRLSDPARAARADREPDREPGRLARERRRRVGVDPSRDDGRRADLGTPGRDLRAARAPEHLRHQHGGPGGATLASLAARAGGQPGPGTLARHAPVSLSPWVFRRQVAARRFQAARGFLPTLGCPGGIHRSPRTCSCSSASRTCSTPTRPTAISTRSSGTTRTTPIREGVDGPWA